MKNETFVIERIYNASPERVWKAITDKEQMKQWYFDLPDFKPEPGFEFQFEAGTDEHKYLHRCKITEVTEGKKLQYSWRYEGFEGCSFVTFELFSEGEKTRLKLTHEGLETFPVSNPDFAKQNFVEGWNEILGKNLKEMLEASENKSEPEEAAFLNSATVEAQMMIRKPVFEVFEAFVNPTITVNFWFTKSSGALEAGKTVTWDWEMYNASTNVLVKEIIPNKKISTEWGEPTTCVDYEFTELSSNTTYVVIKNYGFKLSGQDLISSVIDNTGGFTTVLDGLKAYLEHGINLNLVADKFPHIN